MTIVFFLLSYASALCFRTIGAQLSPVQQSPQIGAITCQSFPAAPECNAQIYDISDNIGYSGNGFAQPAVAKDVLAGYETTHSAANANDGKYGNGASWKGNTANSWLKIDLGCTTQIRSVRFGRDRTGGFADLGPGQVSVFVAKTDVVAAGNSDNDDVEYSKVFQSTGFSTLASGETMQARFAPITGRFVKFQVQNAGAAIDELEVAGNPCLPGKLKVVSTSQTTGPIACQNFASAPQCNAQLYDASENVAYAGNGFAQPAVAKDVLVGFETNYGMANINDGKYGNGAAWIGNSAYSWVKIDLGCSTQIRSLRFGRDRTGVYTDRSPGQVAVFVANNDVVAAGNSDDDDVQYKKVFQSVGFCGTLTAGQTMEARFTAVTARYVKFQVQNSGAAIDEIEVIGHPCVAGKVSVTRGAPGTGPVTCQNFVTAPQCSAQSYDTSDNIAYVGNGFALPAVAKDVMTGFENTHSAANANDGKYGHGSSWIGNTANSWIKIDLGCATQIRSVSFGRDRTAGLTDRSPGQVSVFVATNDILAAGNSDDDNTEYTLVFQSSGFSGVLAASETMHARFTAITGRYVKLQVQNRGAAIDEIEVFGNPCVPANLKTVSNTQATGPVTCQNFAIPPECNAQFYDASDNIAYSGNGFARPAVAKDVLAGYESTHGMANANDGKYGNGASWISSSANSWLKIDLGCATQIRSVRFGRDRTGAFADRHPGQVAVFVAKSDVVAAGNSNNDDVEYTKVFQSSGFIGVLAVNETMQATFPPITARYVKLQVQNSGAAIDELEVFGNPCVPAKVKLTTATASTGPITCETFASAPECNAQQYDTSNNIAYAGNGFALPAVTKDVFAGSESTHGAANLNDGRYGNGASWMSNSVNSWLKVDLGCTTQIRSVSIGRDRTGGLTDRSPGQVSVFVAQNDALAAGNSDDDDVEYTLVFQSAGFSGILTAGETLQARFPAITGRFVKVQVQNRGAAIDEIEVEGNPCLPGNVTLDAASKTTDLVVCQNVAVAP